jgi:hypothetical protein
MRQKNSVSREQLLKMKLLLEKILVSLQSRGISMKKILEI